MGTFSVVYINYFQNVHERYLIRLGNSVKYIYYICLVRQIALNDEIDAIIGYFKLRLDLKLNKYLTHCFDGQRSLGINNSNLIICGL